MNIMVKIKQIQSIIFILIGALMLMWPAFYNGFPLIFPDSGDYISNKGYIYRPPFYAFFISFSSFRFSLWLSVFFQGLIISHLIWLFSKIIFSKIDNIFFLLMIFTLSILSSLPFFTSYILADFFTAIGFLSLYILIFLNKKITKPTRIYIFIICIFCTISHISNLYLSIGFILFCFIFQIGKAIDYKQRNQDLWQGIRPLFRGFVILLLINIIGYKTFSIAPAGGIFIFANLIETGPARKMLEENCGQNDYKICKYLDEIPQKGAQFLWGENSINYKLGEFEGFKDEANKLVQKTIIKYPVEIKNMILNNLFLAFNNHNPLKEANSETQIIEFNEILKNNFGENALKNYLASREMQNNLPYEIVKKIDKFSFPLAILILLISIILNIKNFRKDNFILPLSILVFIFGNFLLCSVTSGIYDRYYSRVTWLAIFGAIIAIYSFIEERKINSKITL